VQAWRRSAAQRQAQAEREAIEQRLRALDLAGVPDPCLDLIRRNGVNPDNEPLKQALRWYEGGSSSLIMGGDTGRGKTVAAAVCAYRGPRRRPGKVAWIYYPELNQHQTWEDADEKGKRRRLLLWEEILDAQLIVVDDVWSAIMGRPETYRNRMVALLTYALDRGREVIMTWNGSDQQQFRNALDADQVFDRLEHWCAWEWTSGDSLRGSPVGSPTGGGAGPQQGEVEEFD
jgi:DNA replication protein DnaC